jgi:ABC-type uncharacterized transport system involved in gliding motility auxiliary subunit
VNRARELVRKLSGKLASRPARYGSNAVVLSIAAVGIVVLLNVLAARYYRRFDVTQARLHSLSPQSLQVLRELDGDIEIVGFYPNGQDQAAFERWLDEYRTHTDRLRYRTIDPIRQPGETELLGWDAYGPGLLVRRDDQSQQVFFPDEQDITSALLKVSRESPKVVYFLGGHNERSPTDYEAGGYGDVAALLEANNYQVRSLNLAVNESVPADAALLVLAGPRTPLLLEEERRIQEYLLAGGKALILVDPALRDRAGSTADTLHPTGINDLLEPWQVRFGDETVIDPQQSLGGDPRTPALTEYGFHQITKDLANTLIALPLAAPIQLPDAPAPGAPTSGALYTALATTSEQSWGELDARSEPLQYDEGTDLSGPLVVMAAVEGPVLSQVEGPVLSQVEGTMGPTTRLVLIGDSDLARNDVLAQIPNGQFLLLNAVNWLAEEEALIAIGPKTGPQQQSIRLSRLQEGAVCLGTLVLIPAAIALAGLIVWSRRRRPRPSRGERFPKGDQP